MSVRRALVDCAVLSLQDSCVFYPCCKSCFSRIDTYQLNTTTRYLKKKIKLFCSDRLLSLKLYELKGFKSQTVIVPVPPQVSVLQMWLQVSEGPGGLQIPSLSLGDPGQLHFWCDSVWKQLECIFRHSCK